MTIDGDTDARFSFEPIGWGDEAEVYEWEAEPNADGNTEGLMIGYVHRVGSRFDARTSTGGWISGSFADEIKAAEAISAKHAEETA